MILIQVISPFQIDIYGGAITYWQLLMYVFIYSSHDPKQRNKFAQAKQVIFLYKKVTIGLLSVYDLNTIDIQT